MLYRYLIVVLALACSCAALSKVKPSSAEEPPKPAAPSLNESQRKLLQLFRSEFVTIEPGSFQRGSADGPRNERPRAKVALKQPFHMAAYEVPQNLWQAVVGANPSRWKGPRNSVEMLSSLFFLPFLGSWLP